MGARLQGHSLTPAPGVHRLQGAHPPCAGWSAGLRGSRVRQAGLNATWEMRTQRWLPSWASLSSPALREASSSVMRTYSSPWGGPGGEEYRPANDHIVSSEAGSSATQATTASPATAWRQPYETLWARPSQLSYPWIPGPQKGHKISACLECCILR